MIEVAQGSSLQVALMLVGLLRGDDQADEKQK
jgi:hypothetical protein